MSDDRRVPPAAGAGETGDFCSGFVPDYEQQVRRSIGFAGVGHDFFIRGKAERLIVIARRLELATPGARLIDIGCGYGLIHPWLQPAGFAVAGVDIAAEAIAEARRRQPGNDYFVYDGERLPFADASFDLATTICVMHHVPPPRWPHFVAEAWRALKPGGALLVFEHNPWNPLTRVAVSRCDFDRDATLLSPPTLTRLMAEAGFVALEREFLFFTPFEAAAARRLDAFARRLPFGAQYVVVGRKRG
jgi:SAM-dependent methyltransferase